MMEFEEKAENAGLENMPEAVDTEEINTEPAAQEGAEETTGQGEEAQEATTEEAPTDEPASTPEPPEELTQTQAFSKRLNEMVAEKTTPLEQERNMLLQALEGFGYKGTPQEIADQIEAGRREITVEELRQERQAQESRARELLKQDPEYIRTQQELETLRQREAERQFAEDLAAVKAINPGENAKSVQELGADFIRLRAAGVSAEVAYSAIQATRPKVQAPPDPGKVQATDTVQSGYFTPEQVRGMGPAEVERNLAKIEESMKQWK